MSDDEVMEQSKRQKAGPKHTRQWVKNDLPVGSFSTSDCENRYADVDYTPTLLFEKFINDEVIDMLVNNTNKYAMIDKGKVSFQTSSSEMRVFMAILFTSGYAPLPRRRMYWESSDDVHNTAISNSMTRNRFEELMMCVHVADNAVLSPNDRMAKIRPLFNSLNEKFLAEFPYDQHLSIDESMVPYYGRHSAKQFIRGKPIRFGFKVWSLNTPLGYCVQMDPYQGAGVTDTQLGLGGSVVVKLVNALPSDNYVLYFDNFFTSFKLLQYLANKNVKATGTVRANRVENCPVISVDIMKKKDRGTYDYRLDKTSNILVTRWNDNSVVTMASTCHGIEPIGNAKRWSKAHKKTIDITQPHVIGQYNKSMGGVDRMDQNISCYRISIRSKKWWWALFAYLLDVAMQNAWLVYRKTKAAQIRPLDQLDFRREVCIVYYKQFNSERPCIGRPLGRPKALSTRVPLAIRHDGVNHFVVSSGTQRRCVVCQQKTRRQCEKCDVGLHLECSASFHG
jgi:DNA excision repair protein ERCC-6